MTFLNGHYELFSFLSVLLLAVVHLLSTRIHGLDRFWHHRLLSAAGGTSVAYVFIKLLPELSEGQALLTKTFAGTFPYLEKHVYILALVGVIFTYGIEQWRHKKTELGKVAFWSNLLAAAFLNFLIGDAIADQSDREVRPLTLFVIAMGLHNLVNDQTLRDIDEYSFKRFGNGILVSALFIGWLTGYLSHVSQAAIALALAFIAGGIIVNVLRHELPNADIRNFGAFAIASIAYALLLLSIG